MFLNVSVSVLLNVSVSVFLNVSVSVLLKVSVSVQCAPKMGPKTIWTKNNDCLTFRFRFCLTFRFRFCLTFRFRFSLKFRFRFNMPPKWVKKNRTKKMKIKYAWWWERRGDSAWAKKNKIKNNLGALKCHQNHVQKYPQNDLRVQNLNQRNKIKINICRMFIST